MNWAVYKARCGRTQPGSGVGKLHPFPAKADKRGQRVRVENMHYLWTIPK